VILTSDPATFRSLPSLPRRLIPNLLRGSRYPPYGLRKIESLIHGTILPPERVWKVLKDGDALGVYVNDPMGMTEVSRGLTKVFGEPPYHVISFQSFCEEVTRKRKGRDVRVIVGGPGAWELSLDPPDCVDTVLLGEAEETLPKLMGKAVERVVTGEPARHFVPIEGPSALGEVEVMRRDVKVPMDVVRREMEVQSTLGRVNLISPDLFSYGDGLEDLLMVARNYGRVTFSQISVKSSGEVDLEGVRNALGLNAGDWRSPVLSQRGCTLEDVDADVLRRLNENFIYPMVYTPEEKADQFMEFKTLVIPLPSTARYYETLYRAWVHNEEVLKFKFKGIPRYVLRKSAETSGEYLRKLNLRGVHVLNLLIVLLRSAFQSEGE